MARRKWNQSIGSRIKSMSWRIVLLLIVPVAVSLTMMLVFSVRYSLSMERMGDIAALKPMISEEIPGAVWRVVSGRETMAESQTYPLIQFIPDSSVVGKGADAVLTQGWGGLIWATDAEQAKHPAFVVVPIFTETIVDDNHNHSEQIDVAMRMLQSLTEAYSIDTNRIYTTGQSMGGMTSFYESIAYPDFFAAYLFVGSQWDVSQLGGLEEKPFFYIVAAGDPKASAGQAELLAVFDADNAVYSHAEWSTQENTSAQNDAVASMLAEGHNANFVTFTEGSTIANGQSSGPAGEHMTSFDYAYKIEAVRDWLFQQTK